MLSLRQQRKLTEKANRVLRLALIDGLIQRAEKGLAIGNQTGMESTIRELDLLPRVEVTVCSPLIVNYMRMKQFQCHENCSWYQHNDPTKSHKAVTGWIVDQEHHVYIHHSVIYNTVDDYYQCITPMPIAIPDPFLYVPDPDIRIVPDIGFQRKGLPVPTSIAKDPGAIVLQLVAAIAELRQEARQLRQMTHRGLKTPGTSEQALNPPHITATVSSRC